MSSVLFYAVLLILGITPSLIWLGYYLRKDSHPEPNYLLVKAFLMGIVLSPLAVLFQRLFVDVGSSLAPSIVQAHGSGFFLWSALTEELVKFFAVVLIISREPDFDEPVDAMIYLVTAALGFAAMENILVMFQLIPTTAPVASEIVQVARIWSLRFVGATLLHALSSALVGYFFALSWFYEHHRIKLTVLGITLATLFHFTFNTFLSVSSTPELSLLYSTGLLVAMAFLVSILFDKIKEQHEEELIRLA